MSSLSTQLVRGAIALPLLLCFGILGFAREPSPAPVRADSVALAVQADLMDAVCQMEGGKARVFVLAKAPADLGTLVVRVKAPCRA